MRSFIPTFFLVILFSFMFALESGAGCSRLPELPTNTPTGATTGATPPGVTEANKDAGHDETADVTTDEVIEEVAEIANAVVDKVTGIDALGDITEIAIEDILALLHRKIDSLSQEEDQPVGGV